MTRTKAKGKGRIADDDVRRMGVMWSGIRDLLQKHRVGLMVVEHYAPRAGAMGGNSWKTALGYQLSLCAAFSMNVPVYVRRPDDLKRAFLGGNKGSKEETIEVMGDFVDGIDDALSPFAKGKHEHMVDAIGHAYLGLDLIRGERNVS